MADRTERLIEVWKTTIDVQKHFNDLEMRIRSVAITVLAAFLAAAGYTMKESLHLNIFGVNLSLTVLVFMAGAVCWSAFYLMDRFWYHRLLKGAVSHALKVEAALEAEIPEISLTKSIGESSAFMMLGRKIDSNRKMDWFYRSILGLLLIGALASFFNQPPVASSAAASREPLRHGGSITDPGPLESVTDLPMPSGHRAVAFSTCCRVPVPFDATAVLPGNVIDTEVMRIERPGLAVKLEYVRAGNPERPLVEGAQADVTIDGVRTILRETAAEGSRRLHVSVGLPSQGDAHPLDRVLTVRADCTSDSDCAAAKRIIQGLDWMP